MSCRDALVTNILTATSDQTVEAILKDMRKNNISLVPIIDSDNVLVGQFSIGLLLEDTLPVSLAVGGAAGGEKSMTNVVIPAASGLSRRLQRSLAAPVSALMERPAYILHPDASLETAIQQVRQAGNPVPVVERDKNILLGLISQESILDSLEKNKS